MALFMNNGYFQIKNGYLLIAPQVHLSYMQWTLKRRIDRQLPRLTDGIMVHLIKQNPCYCQ